MQDDLLECDCLTRTERMLEDPQDEKPTAVDILNKHREEDVSDEEDEQPARFVAASQYDPAGVSQHNWSGMSLTC
jgi:hypothetical protein